MPEPTMGLNDDAEALKQQFFATTEDAIVERVGAGLAGIAALHPAGQALAVGDAASDFELSDTGGRRVRLGDRLARSPVVVSFYRGGWCPFCSLELRAWRQQVGWLREAGAELLAITPESAERSRTTAAEHGIDFPVLLDTDQSVAARYGLVFDLPEAARDAQQRLGAPLDRLNADGTWRLPVPATYVIDTAGTIRWAHVADDYTTRAEPTEVIAAVRTLA